ncbi:hypothetical protein BC827DRAFT_1380765 [Russula dissimulans]|nr:hypothetical protein BC827DRAFT_1380765 [Russula dissimulans]
MPMRFPRGINLFRVTVQQKRRGLQNRRDWHLRFHSFLGRRNADGRLVEIVIGQRSRECEVSSLVLVTEIGAENEVDDSTGRKNLGLALKGQRPGQAKQTSEFSSRPGCKNEGLAGRPLSIEKTWFSCRNTFWGSFVKGAKVASKMMKQGGEKAMSEVSYVRVASTHCMMMASDKAWQLPWWSSDLCALNVNQAVNTLLFQ